MLPKDASRFFIILAIVFVYSIPTSDTCGCLTNCCNTLLNPACAVCRWVLEKLESLLPIERGEAELRELLDKICTEAPESMVTDCDNFINEYTEKIIDFLLKNVAITALCSSIGIVGPCVETS